MNHHGHAVPVVVGRHHRARAALFKSHAKRHRVVLAEEPLVEVRRTRCASVLILIRQKMLHQTGSLPVLRIRPLQAARESHRQRPHQKRVLSVRLLRASPARIAAQVGIGRAHHHAPARRHRVLVVVARLVALLRPSLFNQLRIPRGAHALFLRKSCRRQIAASAAAPIRRPAQRQSMQPFHLAAEHQPQPRKLRMVRHQLDLLRQRQPLQQIVDACLVAQLGIAKRIVRLRHGHGCSQPGHHTRHKNRPTHTHRLPPPHTRTAQTITAR